MTHVPSPRRRGETIDPVILNDVVTNTGAATVATLPQAWLSWEPFCREEGIKP